MLSKVRLSFCFGCCATVHKYFFSGQDSLESILKCRGEKETLENALQESRISDLKHICKTIKRTVKGKSCKQIRKASDHKYLMDNKDACENILNLKFQNIKKASLVDALNNLCSYDKGKLFKHIIHNK